MRGMGATRGRKRGRSARGMEATRGRKRGRSVSLHSLHAPLSNQQNLRPLGKSGTEELRA